MKIIFAGTPEFAAAHLQALLDAFGSSKASAEQHQIVAVYTQPDRPAGRGKKLKPSAVKSLAIEHELALQQPINFKDEESIKILRAFEADLMVVVAYGLLLPKAVLDAPKYGCINVHGSLLPKWRGAAPIQRALWAGDAKTGVAIMQMDEGLDTGDVLLEESIAIQANDTSASLYQKLAELGPKALVKAIQQLPSLSPSKQDDNLASYAKKLSKEEAKCDWSQDAEQLERNVRAFNPWPIAWFTHQGESLKIHKAQVIAGDTSALSGQVIAYDKNGLDVACGKNVLRILELQLPGKQKQAISDIKNGRPTLFGLGEPLN